MVDGFPGSPVWFYSILLVSSQVFILKSLQIWSKSGRKHSSRRSCLLSSIFPSQMPHFVIYVRKVVLVQSNECMQLLCLCVSAVFHMLVSVCTLPFLQRKFGLCWASHLPIWPVKWTLVCLFNFTRHCPLISGLCPFLANLMIWGVSVKSWSCFLFCLLEIPYLAFRTPMTCEIPVATTRMIVSQTVVQGLIPSSLEAQIPVTLPGPTQWKRQWL